MFKVTAACPSCGKDIQWTSKKDQPTACPSCDIPITVETHYISAILIWTLLELPLFGLDVLGHGAGVILRILLSGLLGLFIFQNCYTVVPADKKE